MKKILGIMLALMLTLAPAAMAATITAQGSGQVELMPDIARLSLGVSTTSSDVSHAMTQANELLSAVREALKRDGVDSADISVNDIFLYTQYDYNSDDQAVTGYNISHSLDVTVRNVDTLGKVIDDAVSAGANQVNGVSFRSSQNEEAYKQALALAVKNAQEHAQVMAEAQGLTLGELQTLSEGGASGLVMYESADKGMGAVSASETQVDVGALSISASVTAVFAAE